MVKNSFVALGLVSLLLTNQPIFAAKNAPAKSAKVEKPSTERPKAHGPQGTGKFKGAQKERHQKAGPQNEKKKKSEKWTSLKK